MPSPPRLWVLLFWVILAVLNTIAAFKSGPNYFGWEVPNGLTGIVAGSMWVFALAELTGRW